MRRTLVRREFGGSLVSARYAGWGTHPPQGICDQVRTFPERFEVVGDVRGGLGLFAAIGFVKDQESKEKFGDDAKLSDL